MKFDVVETDESNSSVITTSDLVSPVTVTKCGLSAPPCTVGITDGSERGDYVPQAHLLRVLGRPHHVVNLMFQYYPDMAGWPTQGVKWNGFYRNNTLNKGDGYFPLVLDESEPWGQFYLRQIEDVRRFGQEPQLTLTLHADTPSDTLVRIAKSLAPYAPMRIRINHECNGTWFYFNQKWSYKQVSDFFIRFHDILHTHAPGVSTVACWNGPGDAPPNPVNDGNAMAGQLTEDQLAPMFRVADIVSYDQYASLHYGWPQPDYDPSNPTQYFKVGFDNWWKLLDHCHQIMSDLRGKNTDIEIHEINEDADVVGLEQQARWTTQFYNEAFERKYSWLKNITFYMFRDRGGLGLEKEDVDNPLKYQETPSLPAYRACIRNTYFGIHAQAGETCATDDRINLHWKSLCCASGIEATFDLPYGSAPAAIELPTNQHLLINIGGNWQIKPVGVNRINPPSLARGTRLSIRLFAPPADGKNNSSDGFKTVLESAPLVRIR